MKDTVAFLAFMRGLLPDCTTTLTLGGNGLTVSIAARITGRWYGYILDADDLEKPVIDLAGELAKIHESRSRGDDKRPALHNRHGDHDLRLTNSERFVIREMLSVAYIHARGTKAAYFVHKCEKNGLSRGDALALADAFDVDVPEELWGKYASANPDLESALKPDQSADLASMIAVMVRGHGPHSVEDLRGESAATSAALTSSHLDMLAALDLAIAVGDGTWCLTEHGEVIARWEGCLPLARRILAGQAIKAVEQGRDEPATAEEVASVQAANIAIATADEREEVRLTLESSQRAFLKAWGWTSNGSLWSEPDVIPPDWTWDSDHAVLEQNQRIRAAHDTADWVPNQGRPSFDVLDAMERIKAAVRALPHGSHSRSSNDVVKDINDSIVAELKRAFDTGRL